MYHTAPLHRQTLTVQFNAEQLTSNAGGVLLLQQVDQKLQLTETITRLIHDPRDPCFTIHIQRDLLAQRIYAICLWRYYRHLKQQN